MVLINEASNIIYISKSYQAFKSIPNPRKETIKISTKTKSINTYINRDIFNAKTKELRNYLHFFNLDKEYIKA
jgi:hypothetical protein